MSDRKAPPPPDPENGFYAGRRIAKRFVSPDGFTVLVGKTAEDNDILSLRLGEPQDFWFHLAGDSGSHVVVRNPERLPKLPKETVLFAAGLAAGHSKAKNAGRVSVHMARCEDISKPRGLAAGKVELRRWESVMVKPTKGSEG